MTKSSRPTFGRLLRSLLATSALVVAAQTASVHAASAAQTLTIESWRNDDADIWTGTIIPAFNAKYPDIKVEFKPTPPTEYNAALNARLAGGTAGDLITCRPFDASLDLYKKGNLIAVDDIKGIENFSPVAKSAWQTDDGKTTFCMPMASVIHGFIYNKEIFKELGLTPPKTMAEFHQVIDKIKADGRYTPIDMGTADQWEAATMGFQNIGPNYWHGEEGRKALIAGTAKFTDAPYVADLTELASWAPYMGNGYKAQKYPDSQNLFALGRAAIYPAGSWDIPVFRKQADFEFDAFAPPLPDGRDEMLHQRPHGYRHGHQSEIAQCRGGQDLPRLARLARVRHPLFQRAAGLLLALQRQGRGQGSGGQDLPRLARDLREHDPRFLPDPLPRHAQSGERALERELPGDQRHHDAGGRRQEAGRRPGQLVPAA